MLQRLIALAALLVSDAVGGEPGRVVLQRMPGTDSCGPATIVDAPPADNLSAEELSVSATSKGCWAPALIVRRDAKTVVLPLWPEAVLAGRLAVPKGAELPSSIAVQVESAAVPRSRFDCAVTKGRFRCAVPATTLDLRLAASGFAPRYFFGIDRPDLGEVALVRGGSVAGTVRFDGDGPPLTDVALELKVVTPPPMSEGWTSEEQRLASRTMTARPNARGFFQFAQVEPGQYTVIARSEGWSRARQAGIEVREGEESALPQPLLIEPLAEVDVLIQPSLDPYGKPWQVSIAEMVPLSSLTTRIVETEASMTGAWSVAGIHSGFHRVEVSDHRGSRFAYSIVDVSAHMAPVVITMSSIAVRGTIRVGDEPLRARLEFRNGRGTTIAMRSAADGRFSGALPRDGRWDIDVISGPAPDFQRRTVNVRPENGVADIDLRLPDTRLAGKVVDASGEPATAFVRLWSEERTYLGGTSTDEHGRFQFAGMEPGDVYLEAVSRTSQNAKSGFVPVSIETTPADELTVVLRRAARLSARLVTPSGAPVAGAIVRYVLPDRPLATMEEVSGPDGRFSLSLSPGTRAVDLAILPPALPVKVARVPIGDGTREIVLGRSAGILEIEMDHPTPDGPGSELWLEHAGATFHVLSLRYPANWMSAPRGFHRWGSSIEIEAGEYAICADPVLRDRCMRKVLAPGAVERVDGRALLR